MSLSGHEVGCSWWRDWNSCNCSFNALREIDVPHEATSVRTQSDYGRCEQCGNPLPPPSPRARPDQKRRFCRAGCRSYWHQARKIARLNEILATAQTEIAELFKVQRRKKA